MMFNKVYENDYISVSETGRNYDFVAVIENKTDYKIKIVFTGNYEGYEPITLDKHDTEYDWCGIFFGKWFEEIDGLDISLQKAFMENEIEIYNAENEEELLYIGVLDKKGGWNYEK